MEFHLWMRYNFIKNRQPTEKQAIGEDKRRMEDTSDIEREKTVEYGENVNVKIVYPENVSEVIRQQKLNRMYDIFSGAMRRNSVEKIAE